MNILILYARRITFFSSDQILVFSRKQITRSWLFVNVTTYGQEELSLEGSFPIFFFFLAHDSIQTPYHGTGMKTLDWGDFKIIWGKVKCFLYSKYNVSTIKRNKRILKWRERERERKKENLIGLWPKWKINESESG